MRALGRSVAAPVIAVSSGSPTIACMRGSTANTGGRPAIVQIDGVRTTAVQPQLHLHQADANDTLDCIRERRMTAKITGNIALLRPDAGATDGGMAIAIHRV